MGDMSAEEFVQSAFDLNLITQRQMQMIWSNFGTRNVPFADIQNFVLRSGLMTNYQIDKVLRGERAGFFYGDYKVLYFVGNGSFARVYRAVHKDTGKIVALKVLRKRYSEKREDKDRFVHEGEMGMKLRHPNIVPIYEVHGTRGIYFLVMAFVEGQSLRDFVKVRKKVKPIEATKLISDIVAGLDYAAQTGITHRDLKLSNVLVSTNGRAQLVDFGLASIAEGVDDKLTNQRTIDYAGLERATGVRKDDPRSDIFFAGCMYYHMLTGHSPLRESRDRLQRLSVDRYRDVKPITDLDPHLPAPVVLIARKAMELDPEKRYESPSAMLADLQKAMQRLNEERSGGSGSLEGIDRTVMVIESQQSMQDIFREQLKKYGYRVLMIGDPYRALDRFNADSHVANGILFSTSNEGRAGVDAFKEFTSGEHTRDTPAILLLGKNQSEWAGDVSTSDIHQVLTMPVKMSQIREALQKLLATGASTNAH
ncbi:MAG: protein kinase [Planctomycetales bacterium]|nr:protein kinase [Planctomycetales bacterium]